MLFAYFLGFAVLVRTLITFYEIPSTAMVAELSRDYDERTSMLGYRYFFGWWGGLAIYGLALAAFLQPTETVSNGMLNLAGWHAYGLTSAILIAAAILISAIGTHRHIPKLRAAAPERRPFDARRTAREFIETLSNRNFLVLFAAGLFSAMAIGLNAGLNIYFYTYFWELTTDQIFLIVMSLFFSAAIGMALTPPLARAMGKKSAALVTFFFAVILAPAPILLRLAGLFPENGSDALLPTLTAFIVVDVALFVASSILISAMVADVVEESEVATGRRSEGVFFAGRSFIHKAISGSGALSAGLVLALIDFPQGAEPGQVPEEQLFDLGLVFAPLYVGIYLVALGFVAAYRISRADHEANLARLSPAEPAPDR
jgi:Na+/melibiose symporter-like transporter